jgi:hypothetical protein
MENLPPVVRQRDQPEGDLEPDRPKNIDIHNT